MNETDRGTIRARLEGVMRAISSKAMGGESNFQVLAYCGVAVAREAEEGESPVSQVLFALERARSGGRRNSVCFYDAALRLSLIHIFITFSNRNVGSALSLVLMVLIIISIGLLRKADPKGEGGALW